MNAFNTINHHPTHRILSPTYCQLSPNLFMYEPVLIYSIRSLNCSEHSRIKAKLMLSLNLILNVPLCATIIMSTIYLPIIIYPSHKHF